MKMVYRIFISPLLLTFLIFVPSANALTLEEIQREIIRITEEIQKVQRAESIQTQAFNRDLYYGVTDDEDVIRLQIFLIDKNLLSRGLNTGNFYGVTFDAVRAYQRANSISATGYFGPITRSKINEEIKILNSITALKIKIVELQIIEAQKPALIEEDEFIAQSDYELKIKPGYDWDYISLRIHNLINAERVNRGLGILAWDDNAAKNLALLHSQDQAGDNVEVTNPDLLCHYPTIRHEGFSFGFNLIDRLANKGINYKSAGENIVIFSMVKNLIYKYQSDSPPESCPEVLRFKHEEGRSQEETVAAYNDALNKSQEVVRGLPSISWVNREWLSVEEAAFKAVNLWLDSPPHKENLLRPEYNYSGVGIAPVNDYLVITQNFIYR